MKKIIITRPLQDGLRLADKITALGFEPVIMPMIEIEILPRTPNLESINSLIFTSANGVRALMENLPEPHQLATMKVFAVGKKTAEMAQSYGFTNIITADGNADALADLICQQADNQHFLYHASADNHPHHLAEKLQKAGLKVRRESLYIANAAKELPDNFFDILPDCAAILFFSPRTAKIFLKLFQKYSWQNQNYSVVFVCLSNQIRTVVENTVNELSLSTFKIKNIVIKQPDEALMLEIIKQLLIK